MYENQQMFDHSFGGSSEVNMSASMKKGYQNFQGRISYENSKVSQ